MRKNSFTTIIIAILPLLLSACDSSGTYKLGEETSQLNSSYESVKLVINPKADGASDAVPDIRSSLAGQLISSGQFHRVADKDQRADVTITVDVTGYEQVSGTQRVLWGVFAGSNKLTADVTVTSGRTGKVIRSFTASGESASHPLSGESEFSDALRQFSKNVALGLSS